MKTQNLSTLKIHKLTQAQYDRELAAGRIDENALYLTPDESIDTYSKSEIDNKLENISFEVDSSLSTTSTNPVENKAITNWLADNVKNYYLSLDGNKIALFDNTIEPIAGDDTPAGPQTILQIRDVYGNDHNIGADWSNIKNIPNASTSSAGIVQLTNSASSTSTTTAATPNSVRLAFLDAINYVDDLNYYSTFGFQNSVSTYAGAPSDNDGGYELVAKGSDKIRFKAFDERIYFIPSEDVDGTPVDEVTIVINADPEGSADAALEEAKAYTDSVLGDIEALLAAI